MCCIDRLSRQTLSFITTSLSGQSSSFQFSSLPECTTLIGNFFPGLLGRFVPRSDRAGRLPDDSEFLRDHFHFTGEAPAHGGVPQADHAADLANRDPADLHGVFKGPQTSPALPPLLLSFFSGITPLLF